MPKCKHKSLDITETMVSRRTYRVLQGKHADTSADCEAMPREFHVKCLDCGFEKTYKYAPGMFGPQSKPCWLYEIVDMVNGSHWGIRVPPRDASESQ